MGIFQSYTGRVIDLENPTPESVDIEDIAHALSMTCRFGGHCREFYSVAEHALHVEQYGATLLGHHGASPLPALALLLHDAAEAYVGDVISPLKRVVRGFVELENRWHQVIGERFGLGDALSNPSGLIHACDMAILAQEAVVLFHPVQSFWWANVTQRPKLGGETVTIECWSPAEARRRFLARFRQLQSYLGVVAPWTESGKVTP